MKITWLGQAGLLFETGGVTIMVDPYLSDSVAKIQPKFKRRVPVDESLFEIKPDIIILTHDHLDHTDPETLSHYLKPDSGVLVLASPNAWTKVRSEFPDTDNNFVMFSRGTEWSFGNLLFRAVHAEHSDFEAIGVVIYAEGKTYYVTGDTLYNDKVFASLDQKIDYVFLPTNGVGNNMNFDDAKRFCDKIKAHAVPLHCGLFDSLSLHDFPYKNKTVPEFYKEIKL